jgi:hypothetical protein
VSDAGKPRAPLPVIQERVRAITLPDVDPEDTARALQRMERTGRPGRLEIQAEEITYEPKRTPTGKLTKAAARGELGAFKQVRFTLAQACERVLETSGRTVTEVGEKLAAECGGELPQRYRVALRLVAIATGDLPSAEPLHSVAAANWLADRIDGPVVQRAEVRGSNVVVHVTVPEDAPDSQAWAERWAGRLSGETVQGG